MPIEINEINYSNKLFEKTFVSLSEREVDEIYNHYLDVYNKLKNLNNIAMPRLLHRKGNCISYELIENIGSPLSDVVFNDVDKIKMAALALKEIHQEGNVLHSDYVLHNIFIFKEMMFIIDPNPPSALKFNYDLLYNDERYDIYSIIYSIIDTKGLKQVCYYFKDIKNISSVFLNEYNYKGNILNFRMLIKFFHRMYKIKKNIGSMRVKVILNSIVSLFVFVFVILMSGKNAID